ncbi:MAG: hypothetical protein AAF078_06180, partial [Planctomycetota bacterium]
PADATLLAVAGLKRLGLLERASAVLPLETMLPAACQGALAVQCRSDDHVTVTRLLPLNHAASSAAVHAERQIVARLGASCDSALGVLVRWVEGAKVGSEGEVELWVRAMTADGSELAEAKATCAGKRMRHGVRDVVAAIEAQGGRAMLEARELSAAAWAEEAQGAETSVVAAEREG